MVICKDNQVVVVVDPYSSGKYLVQELKEQNWQMVAFHLVSRSVLSLVFNVLCLIEYACQISVP